MNKLGKTGIPCVFHEVDTLWRSLQTSDVSEGGNQKREVRFNGGNQQQSIRWWSKWEEIEES